MLGYRPSFLTHIDTPDGSRPIPMAGPETCTARQGQFRCTLDRIHQHLGTAHGHRNEKGELTSWRES